MTASASKATTGTNRSGDGDLVEYGIVVPSRHTFDGVFEDTGESFALTLLRVADWLGCGKKRSILPDGHP